ncbi:hypothetical protein F751_4197 [Auxenochlorella protothecoides]|uniref:Uncharacterized protein n=1 Tax=Auxenochlorella protothecoides TaxID=3075 RepID=A0A087SJP1_AUXPR|nr:hypothetical protein F751_4197 [Auxenochlorella protothecoides]KFM25945.1 hypothetical protein F751_4197 [Auxenochlorella protothecoides]RMZ52767.1 hypothetical protein APUTEX25_000886 [Auxenochlorella protothecoides]|eukprot:RMZ52767.1 hypothetical protein APUTEX25_000886 [Auxenochlorella protothecoides]
MYMLSGPPFRVDPDDPQCVLDRGGEQVELMGSSREILAELATQPQWQDTEVAYVSRTEYPQWANACLKAATGIAFKDMLFFDNESWNIKVSRLGVVSIYTPHGMTSDNWEYGLAEFRKKASQQ